jgi:2-phosphosulfolactate phosphatase
MLSRVVATLDIALLPAEAAETEADCFVVIDALRATTTLATLFAGGITDVVVAADIDLARTRAREQRRLLFGEVHGLPPSGFDHGNSPVEAAGLDIRGRGAVLFTTNGTNALCRLAGRAPVFTAAPANQSAVVAAVASYQRVVLVCAGNAAGRRFALEDFLAAGQIAAEVVRDGAELGDAAALAVAVGRDHGLAAALQSSHARYTASIGFGADIEFAARVDSSHAAPFVVDHGDGWARLEDRA